MQVTLLAALLCIAASAAFAQDDEPSMEKRAAMRNALVRFGRSGGMRNALVRFGKRSAADEETYDEDKRNAPQPFVRFGRSVPQPFVRFGRSAPQPFVRFGRSGHLEHMHDILSTLQRLESANN